MNRDYDDALERARARRSQDGENRPLTEREKWENRRRMQEQDADQLDVWGDPSVHTGPRKTERAVQPEEMPVRRSRARSARSDGAGASGRQPVWRSESGQAGRSRQSGARQAGAGQTVSRQTAASGENGRSLRMQVQQEKRKKRRRIIGLIIAECIALVCIFGYRFMAKTMAGLQRDTEFVKEEIQTNDIGVEFEEKMRGYWTIAVFGVDSRDSSIDKFTNSDVIMLCNINLDTGEIKLVSVFRDSYLNISPDGSYNKINQAYFLGGPSQAVEALNRNLDLKIGDYVTFNWKAVAQAIDILGGVDIELSKAEFHYINSFITETVKATGIGSHQLTHAGMNHLDGVQAVAYGRLRLMDTDYARTERQRKVVQQAFEKCKQADFQTLYTLIGTVFPNVKTSLWVDDLVNNARNISKFHLGENTGFPQARGEASLPKKGAVVVPATLETNVAKLHEFLFGAENYTPSGTVKEISRKIASDTGISKEGQYIDKVGTSGGVIQPPKTTAAATEASDDDEDEGYQYVYVKDKNGKRVRKRLEMETDEDGEYIEYETDEDGYLIEESSSAARPTAPTETDEDGNPIETTRNPLLPSILETDEDGNIVYPTDEDGNAIRPGRPGNAGESESASDGRPGSPTGGQQVRPTDPSESSGTGRPGGTAGNEVVDRPGGSAGTGSSNGGTGNSNGTGPVDRPGGSANRPTEPESSSASRPGGSNSTPGTTPTSPSASGGSPGSGTAPTTSASNPTLETIIQAGPGGNDVVTVPGGGAVSAPGQ